VLAVVGALLVALALLRPALLAPVSRVWLSFGQRLASVTTPVVLTLIYWALLTPIGIVRRTVSRSPIARDRAAPSYWVRREPSTPDERRAAMEHQF
jgi:hypothetical protein